MAENDTYDSESLIRDFFKVVGTSYSKTSGGVKGTFKKAVWAGGFDEEIVYTTRKGRTVTRSVKSWKLDAGGNAIANVFSRRTAKNIIFALVLDRDFLVELRKEYETTTKMLEFTVECIIWMDKLKKFLLTATLWGRLFTIGKILWDLPDHYKAIRKTALTVSPEHAAMGEYLKTLTLSNDAISLQIYDALEDRGLDSWTQQLNDMWQVKAKDYHDSQCESRHRGAVGGDAEKRARLSQMMNSMAGQQYAEQASARVALYIQGQLVLQLIDRVIVETGEEPYLYWGCSFAKGHENPYPNETLVLSNYNQVKTYSGSNAAKQKAKELVLKEEERIYKEVTMIANAMANTLQNDLARLRQLTRQSLRYGDYRTRERSLICP